MGNIQDLQEILRAAQDAFDNALAAVEENPTPENLGVLTNAASTRNSAARSLANAEAAANAAGNSSMAIIKLVAAGKNNTTVQVPLDSTVQEAARIAGWNTTEVTYSVISGGNFTTVAGTWRIPSGVTEIMVQPLVRGGLLA